MTRYYNLNDNETIRAGGDNDVVHGDRNVGIDAATFGGRDRFEGSFVDSKLFSGDGNDRFAGTSERSIFERFQSAPELIGDTRYDLRIESVYVNGGAGDDVFRLYGDDNRIEGDAGKDLIAIYGNNDTINSGLDDDRIEALVSNSQISSGAGNDVLSVMMIDSNLVAGDGNDTITVLNLENYETGSAFLTSRSTIDGGAGDDMIRFNVLDGRAHDFDVVLGGAGNDTIVANVSDSNVQGGEGNDRIDATQAVDTSLDGGNGNDMFSIGLYSTRDTVNAGNGDDQVGVSGYPGTIDSTYTVFGGAGNDSVTVSSATASIDGGLGDDRLFVGSTASASVFGGAGYDSLDAHATDQSVLLDGGSQFDTLIGGSAGDTLIGGTSRDTLTGGEGADIFRFTNVQDSFTQAQRSGFVQNSLDLITDFTVGEDKIDLRSLGFTGLGDGTGTTLKVMLSFGLTEIASHLDQPNAAHFGIYLSGDLTQTLSDGDFIFA